MAVQYQEFDGVPLPLVNARQQHDSPRAEQAVRRSINGLYAASSSPHTQFGPLVHRANGEYWGKDIDGILVDESGEWLVDENGEALTAGSAATLLRSQLMAMASKVLVWGELVRVNLDDDQRLWKRAILAAMTHTQVPGDRVFKGEVSLEFQTYMRYWHAPTATVASVSTTSGVTAYFNAEVSAEEVNDAVLTVECTSGTITAFTIRCAELGIDLAWGDSFLADGDVLTIDFGDSEVPDDVEDSYSGFSRGDDHTSRGWLSIPAGLWTFVVVTTGGAADVDLTYYEQFA